MLKFLLLAALAAGTPHWEHNLTPAVLAKARREHRYVLLDVEAVWCHWCHVMDATTYADPRVQHELKEHYLCVKIDQDAHPDLAIRYQDYGWPATVVINPEGGPEIVKKAGYIRPERMINLLQAIVKDPSPIDYGDAPVARDQPGAFTPALVAEMKNQFLAHYDPKVGGWTFVQKFLDWDCIEQALLRGDPHSLAMARQTLDGELHLIDPVWGGVYQYSDNEDWTSPHYEKVMEHQCGNLRAFSQAYRQWRDPRYLRAVRSIRGFLLTFLRNRDGAFMTSMDADRHPGVHSTSYFALNDAGRRRLGLPRIDRHVYARENGWAIEALCYDYRATGDKAPLEAALVAARWIVAHRGFHHGINGVYLGDVLAMGCAFRSLYECTGQHLWLDRAEDAARFIGAHFVPPSGVGLLSPGSVVDRDENIRAYRFLKALELLTDHETVPGLAERALGYLSLQPVAAQANTGGTLTVWHESVEGPLELTLLNPSHRLAAEVMAMPGVSRVIRWSSRPGPPAVTGCRGERCSVPFKTVRELQAWIKKGKSS